MQKHAWATTAFLMCGVHAPCKTISGQHRSCSMQVRADKGFDEELVPLVAAICDWKVLFQLDRSGIMLTFINAFDMSVIQPLLHVIRWPTACHQTHGQD